MSKKLDKLKEVNNTLRELLIKLETHIFVENININVGERKAELFSELKQ